MTSCLQVCNLPLLMSPKEIPTGSSHQSPSVRASASHCQSCALHSPKASSGNYHCSGWREERNCEKPSVKCCGKLRNELTCRSKTSWWWPSKSLQLQDKQHQYPLSSPNMLAAHWKELVLPLAGKDTQFSESCLFRGLRPWRWWLGQGKPCPPSAPLRARRHRAGGSLPERWLLPRKGICLSRCREITL